MDHALSIRGVWPMVWACRFERRMPWGALPQEGGATSLAPPLPRPITPEGGGRLLIRSKKKESVRLRTVSASNCAQTVPYPAERGPLCARDNSRRARLLGAPQRPGPGSLT